MTKQSTTPGSKPTHRLYSVEGEGKKSRWTEIGSAWPNKDGKGFSLSCEAMPLRGRIVMRTATSKPAQQGGQP